LLSSSTPAQAVDPTEVIWNTNPSAPSINPATPAKYGLGLCETSEQLDCIQSVKVRGSSGDFVNAVPLETQSKTWRQRTDENGNYHFEHSLEWDLRSLGADRFNLEAEIFTPAFSEPGFSHPGVFGMHASGFPSNFSLKVEVRTSWLRAQNLQFNAENASFSHKQISGGNLWTFSGSNATLAIYNKLAKINKTLSGDWSEQADENQSHLRFVIHNAGLTRERSWWDPRCANYGYTAQAFNASSAGSPEWNPDTQALEFNIMAPHLDGQGNPNSGFFRLWVHEAFAECQWPGNTLVDAQWLEAEIVNEDGTVQDADISVTKENGVIYLDAGNFHYSIPKFVIRAASGPPSKVSTRPRATSNPAATGSTTNSSTETATPNSAETTNPMTDSSASPTPTNSDNGASGDSGSLESTGAKTSQIAGDQTQDTKSSSGAIFIGLISALLMAAVASGILWRRQLVTFLTRRRLLP